MAISEGVRMSAVRKPPLYPQRFGFCVWCDLPITIRLKKDKTPHKTQSSFHDECRRAYDDALHPSNYYGRLVERDGRRCFLCGVEPSMTVSLEVDHHFPLWSVTDMPVEKRRAYFLIENCRLLCSGKDGCHTKKTKEEAIRRAHYKRLEQKRLGPRKLPAWL
jgi:hypothetical protein